MKRQHIFSLALAAFLVLAGAVIASSGRTEIMGEPAIGSVIEDFSLPDTDGTTHTLSSLKGKNGSVLIFISVQCPVSNAYNERMEKLAQDYSAKGISVIGINANSTEPAIAVKAHASEKHLTFAILKDPGNKLADRLAANATPEAYFLDANNKLLYHGRIDDNRDAASVTANDLRNALDSTLAGKAVAKPTARAFGCSIKRG